MCGGAHNGKRGRGAQSPAPKTVKALGDVGDTIPRLRDIGRQIGAQQHATDIAQEMMM